LIKNLLLLATSIVIAVLVFVGIYEGIESSKYDTWKAEFEKNGDWYGKLTKPSENQILLWEYRPNSVGEKWDTVIATNSYGFRDGEHTYEKNNESLRVAFIGDSVTLGVGIEEKLTFVRLFEDAADIREASLTVEAMSFAVDGYSAIQSLELLETRAAPFSPDIAVYVMCMNDFDFEHGSGEKIRYFKKPASFFFEKIETLYIRFSGQNYYEYYFNKNKADVFSVIRNHKILMEGMGIDFRIAVAPILDRKNSNNEYKYINMHKEIAGELSEMGVPVIDLLEVTSKAETSYALDELHLNEAGHQAVANYFAETLL
jgi:lysophospholipase L1-like esterase